MDSRVIYLGELGSYATDVNTFRGANRQARDLALSGDKTGAESSYATARGLAAAIGDPSLQAEVDYTRQILDGDQQAVAAWRGAQSNDAAAAADTRATSARSALDLANALMNPVYAAYYLATDPSLTADGTPAGNAISQTRADCAALKAAGLPLPVNCGSPESGRDLTTKPGSWVAWFAANWKLVAGGVAGLLVLNVVRK